MSPKSITRHGPLRNPAEVLTRLQTFEHDCRLAVFGSTILSVSCECKCDSKAWCVPAFSSLLPARLQELEACLATRRGCARQWISWQVPTTKPAPRTPRSLLGCRAFFAELLHGRHPNAGASERQVSARQARVRPWRAMLQTLETSPVMWCQPVVLHPPGAAPLTACGRAACGAGLRALPARSFRSGDDLERCSAVRAQAPGLVNSGHSLARARHREP